MNAGLRGVVIDSGQTYGSVSIEENPPQPLESEYESRNAVYDVDSVGLPSATLSLPHDDENPRVGALTGVDPFA